ncbi:hypothetical protein TNCV_180841 [Trichonephila clavipes]|nr:hypothetical protein TNCV_180841 [Trichonephila clavipes]
MDEDRDFEFYVFKPKETKPIKVVVKGLPGCTKPDEINLEDQANCHTITRCLKCGKEHPTKECDIKERQEKPLLYKWTHMDTLPVIPNAQINHPHLNRNNKNSPVTMWLKEFPFANMVSGNKNNNDPSPLIINRKDKALPEFNEINSSDFQDIIDLLKS